MIREEIKILSTVDHPNIVRYYETYEDLKYLYLVMEYCPGGELFDIFSDQCYTERAACYLMKDIFKAINHLHSLKIVHRDIKPENLMFDSDWRIKLIDFGLAK